MNHSNSFQVLIPGIEQLRARGHPAAEIPPLDCGHQQVRNEGQLGRTQGQLGLGQLGLVEIPQFFTGIKMEVFQKFKDPKSYV